MSEPTLESLVELCRSISMSDSDREEQRRSFVYGNLKIGNPHITREIVDRIADENNHIWQST